MLDRSAIVERLREIAALLQLEGSNRYKVRAFQRGAQALEASKIPIKELVEQRRLTELPGIGDALAHQIEELHLHERSELLDALREGLPRGVLELTQIQGIGLHRVRELHARGIVSVADLRAEAIANGDTKLLDAIARYEAKGTPVSLGSGLLLADAISDEVMALDGAHAVRVAGEVARCVAMASELELVVEGSRDLRERVLALPRFASHDGAAVARQPDGTRVRFEFVAPREPKETSEGAELVAMRDLRGVFHCHTTWSDGRNTIEEMARAAEALGAAYITITDHSQSAHYAKGLSVDDLCRQWDEIAEVQERVAVRILRGTEADILADGALDWPDAILEQLDVVIASIHNRHRLDEAKMTERVLRAVRHPLFKVWGHPLGRLIASRPPIPLRVLEVLDAVATSRCAIEINGDPARLDLPPEWIGEARARGIPFVLSSDAHSVNGLRAAKCAVAVARSAGMRKGEVLNTRAWVDFPSVG